MFLASLEGQVPHVSKAYWHYLIREESMCVDANNGISDFGDGVPESSDESSSKKYIQRAPVDSVPLCTFV
jgi:hypothetical protein